LSFLRSIPVRQLALIVVAAVVSACSKDTPTERGPLIVTVTPANPRITNGTEVQLTATVSGASGLTQLFDWSSSQPGIAVVTITGRVTGLTAGSTIITATWNGDSTVTGTTRVDVTGDDIPVGQPLLRARPVVRQ
jgi:type IV pilus biogenesis protein CpaD/CtpE